MGKCGCPCGCRQECDQEGRCPGCHYGTHKCPNCNGLGEVRWPSEDGGSPWMVCPTCGGKGKVQS